MNKIPNIRELNMFLDSNRTKATNYLRVHFSSLSDADLEDIYQDASLALFENIQTGKLTKLTTSLFSYFMSICHNRASVMMRHKYDTMPLKEEIWNEGNEDEIPVRQDKIDELGAFLDELEPTIAIQQAISEREEFVRQCVRTMPEPCNKILWGMYWDNLTHKILAEMLGYKGANSVKTTASRCKDKFSKKLKDYNISI